MEALKYRVALLCEDIRHETGGRVSLMGILGTKLFVHDFPIFFPKLCVFIDWGEIAERVTVFMNIKPPEGVQFPNVRPSAEIRGQAGVVARSMIVLNSFVFPKAGNYVFEFWVNDQLVGSETLNVEKFEAPSGGVTN
jgi:hypothetical protein